MATEEPKPKGLIHAAIPNYVALERIRVNSIHIFSINNPKIHGFLEVMLFHVFFFKWPSKS